MEIGMRNDTTVCVGLAFQEHLLVAVARELSGFIWDIARRTTPIPNSH